MARPAKYSEEDLLIAVEEYAKIHPGKIVYSVLAAWSSENIPALYGVKDVDFRRPHRIGNSGKKTTKKACRKLVDEINQSRSTCTPVSESYYSLLYSTNVESFLTLPRCEQLQAILMARKSFDTLLKRNKESTKECSLLRAENKAIRESNKKILQRQNAIRKALEKHKAICSMLTETIDEERRKAVLSDIGVENGMLDPMKVLESMSIDPENLFFFDKSLESRIPELQRLDEQITDSNNLYTNIIEGINFKK